MLARAAAGMNCEKKRAIYGLRRNHTEKFRERYEEGRGMSKSREWKRFHAHKNVFGNKTSIQSKESEEEENTHTYLGSVFDGCWMESSPPSPSLHLSLSLFSFFLIFGK